MLPIGCGWLHPSILEDLIAQLNTPMPVFLRSALKEPERRVLHRMVAEWIQDVAPDRGLEAAELAGHHYAEALSYGEEVVTDPVARPIGSWTHVFALWIDRSTM